METDWKRWRTEFAYLVDALNDEGRGARPRPCRQVRGAEAPLTRYSVGSATSTSSTASGAPPLNSWMS